MKAIVLLSGGIDSSVMLAMALKKHRSCIALSFDYGQRHRRELESATIIAGYYSIPHSIIPINGLGGSALTHSSPVPKYGTASETMNIGVPSTYVPARNTLFLAYALGQAETLNCDEIYIGPNATDHDPYPDCRPTYIEAFQKVADLGTNRAQAGKPIQIVAPLLYMTKKEIVIKGKELGVPLHMTFSCYDPTPDGESCTSCLACITRTEALSCLIIS